MEATDRSPRADRVRDLARTADAVDGRVVEGAGVSRVAAVTRPMRRVGAVVLRVPETAVLPAGAGTGRAIATTDGRASGCLERSVDQCVREYQAVQLESLQGNSVGVSYSGL